ncbi:MAG TPA: MobF family relaxase [Flavipsychrobacter sp.]|nr:MobF family relaxase [Flavipsychrobacter sp.]
MIRMIQSVSSAQAKSYYSDALLKSDYYLEEQELGGYFNGNLAGRLGLVGKATKADFFALCENRNPLTGGQLTPRTDVNRTTGYDINFHVPKSVSIAHVLSKDDHILKIFQGAVRDTMKEIEADSKTRVRKKGVYSNRDTGELLWTEFIHQTARPAKGFEQEPDMHLHAHCYVFNATYDPIEKVIKAGQFRDIKASMPYYEARFHKRLSDQLLGAGYAIRRTRRSFEIEGIPQRVLDHFSKRTNEIGKLAKEKGITDAKALDALGARTRASKQKGLSMGELKTRWRAQIEQLGVAPEEGAKAVRFGRANVPSPGTTITVQKSLGFALNHHFERASVVPSRRLLSTAYKQAIGDSSVTLAAVDHALPCQDGVLVVEEKGQQVVTTKAVLQEEKRMVALAREGRGRMAPLYAHDPGVRLDGEQGKAIEALLTGTDRVTIIRGAAGTGKTTLMQEAVHWMQEAGKPVTVVASTATASREVLRQEGFLQANTVANLLLNKSAQKGLQDGVLWVDEAGMLGNRDMVQLLELSKAYNARLVLGGDTRQHASIVRGDALRILNTIGGVRTMAVSKIHRQKNADYKEAVGMLAKGKVKEAFEKLDTIGSVVALKREQANAQLVSDYMVALKEGKTALIISPTNEHRKALTGEIRNALRNEGRIGKKEIGVTQLVNLYWSDAEKQDGKRYHPGQVIQATRPLPGMKRGSRWCVTEAHAERVMIREERSGKTVGLPLDRVQGFDVLESALIGLSKGDSIRITRNSYDRDKKRMDNGQQLEVLSVRKNGTLRLQNRLSKQVYEVDQDFGHMDHAHCVTSYASQGKTVDRVLVAQPADTFPATHAKQFYVSVSRAREQVTIYTDDKEQLLAHAEKTGDRTAALELSKFATHKAHIDHQLRRDYEGPDRHRSPSPSIPSLNKTDPDEPRF